MSKQGLSVPVGAVLPYAGNLDNNQLNELGWSICDGTQLLISSYPALFAAIGTCNGGNGNLNFNLPDYRGYFLRGVDHSGTVDKGANQRTAPRTGAATGANVGSVEGFATAVPNTPFTALVPHVPTDDHNAYSGTNADMLEPGNGQIFSSTAGGDAETRPVNAYVNFIIKLVENAGLPTGAIVTFTGASANSSSNLLSYFLHCDGSALPQGQWPSLFKAIGKAHGGSDIAYNLPDYRGRFLRGVDSGAQRDPDAGTRTAMAAGGATGDAVGSIQDWATAAPVNPFTIWVNVGNSEKTSDHCSGHDNSEWNQNSTTVSFTAAGGDKETRPVNVAVDHYVLRDIDANTSDIFPIGAVIGFPGNIAPPAAQWLPCDGSSLSSTDYEDLYFAIGDASGGNNGSAFNLPDYRGYFMRGADLGKNLDPDAASRTAAAPGGAIGANVGSRQGGATGRPRTGDITGPIDHMPTDDADNSCAIWCSSVAEWDGAQAPTVGGGDAETRPINANILYYIKYAATPAS
ncbi:phage tail protein [Pseudomonas sp. 148P]|uniref:Phage tail protein n=1 Tax=Pseudomonas ulcerans TaxID=3115852 RepID=A0ABU7HT68_9PSED|nr:MULTISPECIES: phage tail protein [unclassified Pseudomonas]MEE1924954.1 phage tail protein [Pseudomonas sp. 147P]MEE1934727.1 phage tail protein [Pseudomonas sp. 148P]